MITPTVSSPPVAPQVLLDVVIAIVLQKEKFVVLAVVAATLRAFHVQPTASVREVLPAVIILPSGR